MQRVGDVGGDLLVRESQHGEAGDEGDGRLGEADLVDELVEERGVLEHIHRESLHEGEKDVGVVGEVYDAGAVGCVVPAVDPDFVRVREPEPLRVKVVGRAVLKDLLVSPPLPLSQLAPGVGECSGELGEVEVRGRRHGQRDGDLFGLQAGVGHGRHLKRDVRDDAHQTEAAARGSEVLGLGDFLRLSVAVDVLDATDEIAEGLVATAGAVTDWGIGAAQRDFHHDDVHGHRDGLVVDAPAAESLVCASGADSDEVVAVLEGLFGDHADCLEVVCGGLWEGESRDVGQLGDLVKAEEGNENVSVLCEDRGPRVTCRKESDIEGEGSGMLKLTET